MKQWFLALVASLVVLPQIALAAISVQPYPIDPQIGESNLDAVVVYDSDGVATVAADLSIGGVNTELKNLSFDVPGTAVRVLRMFYRYPSPKKIDGANCEADVTYNTNEDVTKETTYHCVSLLDIKSDKSADSARETVTFPVPLAAGDTARLTFVYKVSGTATKSAAGILNFSYQTPTVPLDLATVRVRVDVAENLYLKGGHAETNSGSDGSLAGGLAVATLQSFSNKYAAGLDSDFSDSSALIKSTTNLNPNGSLTVKGTFATSWLALSWLEFVMVLLILLILMMVIVWGERRAGRLHQTK